MKNKETISDHELLVLIHKGIDMGKLKEQDKSITKKRVDKLFQDLKNYVKKDDFTVPEKKITDSSSIKKEADLIVVNVDGASKGNPGESGIGVAIFDKDSNLINEACDYLGVATNNIAEYKALILGIKLSTKYNAKRVLFKADSELMVKQIKGEYRVKNTQLKLLFAEAQRLLKELPNWKITHVPREENKEADLLANRGVEMSVKNRQAN
ncbi:MAG: ribonuclease HI family protein [Candidatus Scalindua sp.]|jgi:ribonuclease HI|nr:ribonuclease HI family protein [Candidatus Scalindua sp.]MDV5166752.1 ribonuclease HI family protein [Candidatus Scalindua sp.]